MNTTPKQRSSINKSSQQKVSQKAANTPKSLSSNNWESGNKNLRLAHYIADKLPAGRPGEAQTTKAADLSGSSFFSNVQKRTNLQTTQNLLDSVSKKRNSSLSKRSNSRARIQELM